MKTPEDEAFDDLTRKQGMWGGGFTAKRQMAADKLQEPVLAPAPGYCKNCKDYTIEEPLYAQPAQEPVAWTLLLTSEHHGIIGEAGEKFIGAPECYQRVNVYTTPPKREWVELTPEEINAVGAGFTSSSSFHAGALWAQAKLKEKNA